jgi:hypothetical protein
VLTIRVGVVQPDDRQTQGHRQQQTADQVDLLRIGAAVSSRQAEVDHHYRGQCQWHVDPKHVLPAAGQPHHGNPVERAEHTAQLLRGTDPAEYSGAVALRPQVRAQREGDGQQRAARYALDGPADHQHVQVGGHRGDHRSDQEGGQADL